jgi:hypothetical protein
MLPSTPVIIHLKDGRLCLQASTIAVIKDMAEIVKGLTPISHDSKTPVASLVWNQTKDQFLEVLGIAHGDPSAGHFVAMASRPLVTKPCVPAVEIGVPPASTMGCDCASSRSCVALTQTPDFSSISPLTGIHDKTSVSSGALIGLTLKGPQDATFAKKLYQCIPDHCLSSYTTSTSTLAPSKYMAGRLLEFMVPRNGDLAHTFVLKAFLKPNPDGTCWDPSIVDMLFRSAFRLYGNSVSDALHLIANNAVARLRPTPNNRGSSPSLSCSPRRTGTLPISIHPLQCTRTSSA